MPALRTLAILALLACGGCGDGGAAAWTARLELPPPVDAGTRVSVVAWRGTVVVRNGGAGRLDVKATARTPVDWGKFMSGALIADPDGARIIIDAAAKDLEIDVEIAAPPGISLTVGCATADVEATGSWNELRIATGGAVTAHVDAKGGRIAGQRGGASYVALGAGPAGEMRVESASGDVAATVPAAWNGQLKFQTRSGTLDVPAHARLQTIWDEDRRGAVGRMGPALEKGVDPPSVWAVSGTGNVSFHVAE